MRKCCSIHLKNSSTCQRLLYSSAMVSADSCVLLVRNTSFLPRSRSFITNALQCVRVFVAAVGATKPDSLIADHAGGTVHLARIDSLIPGIGFGSQYELTTDLVHQMQTGEVQIGSVHDMERSDFGEQLIQNVDIMQFAIGDMDESRDIGA